jgi:hypothetical protein
MASLKEDIGKLLATLARLFELEGRQLDLSLLRDSAHHLEQTYYDT